ncbi:MAG TPA: hypothetical protein DCS63_06960 [Elusimicrobia bacterium]|nr:hypothetical protein [Elusimicrobiota bacterium]
MPGIKILLASAALAVFAATPSSALAWRGYFHIPMAPRDGRICQQIDPVIIGKTQGYADRLGSNLCIVSVIPTETPGQVYRSYVFFDNGLLMVFSSYGEGEGPGMSSAREFFFFPRRGAPELKMDSHARTISVRMGDGGYAEIDPASAQIRELERGFVRVSPNMVPAERGGVEIPRYAGLMLDAGFRMGESPSGLPDGTSTFRSAWGETCTVKNRDVFSYSVGGGHAFKFTDAQLSAWLRTACPALHAGF